jgi:transposase
MSTQRFTPEFKEEAVRQIVDRGYSVAEVSSRLGVSSHSLYQWVKAVTPDKTEKQAAELIDAKSEILKLRAQLHRTEEERDILKNRPRGLPRPICVETSGAYTEATPGQWPLAFWRRMSPSKNLAQGKLRTQLWWHCA